MCGCSVVGVGCGVSILQQAWDHRRDEETVARALKWWLFRTACAKWVCCTQLHVQRVWFFNSFFLVLLCPMREVQVALPGYNTAATRAALPIPIIACRIFMCPNNGVAASVWDFSCVCRCEWLLGGWGGGGGGGCMSNVRESALKVDFRTKIPCCTRDLNPHQYRARLFSWTLYQLSKPRLDW